VEEPKIFEENAAEKALEYLNKIDNTVIDVKETSKNLINKKLKRSKSEMIVSPLIKLTRTLTKPFVKGKKLLRSSSLNSKIGTNYKKERTEFRKLRQEDERNTDMFNSYFENFSVTSWNKLNDI